MDLFTRSKPPEPPIPGRDYILTLHKYLQSNFSRLAPTAPPPATLLQQSYTLLTLGLDPSSQPLSRSVKVPLTLGFGTPETPKGPVRPLTLRLPPDRLLYLLLRWQALPQELAHVGRTDVPVAEGVPYTARGAAQRESRGQIDGDVQSVRSWAGSMRSVSMGSMGMNSLGRGWWTKEEPSEDQILLALYRIFIVLPALLIHPPFFSDRPIAELVEAGGYTQLGGVDVRVPLDVLRNLQILELEAYDPRALLLPVNTNLRSLTVRDVQDGDDWVEELLSVQPPRPASPSSPRSTLSKSTSVSSSTVSSTAKPRFPLLRHLSLPCTSLLSFPTLPLDRLTSLDLSHNLLNSIPSSLAALSSLRSLNLSYNLITSVRNAPSSLGNISTLNISHNRIDCLLGLDRILGLQRVDVRSNELLEVGEIGRLAVLPDVKEVWTAGNAFNSTTAAAQTEGLTSREDWRVELGFAFAQEGRDKTVFDDTPFSWNERRAIDALLQSRGRVRPANNRTPTAPVTPRVVRAQHPASPTPSRQRANGTGNGKENGRGDAAPPTPDRITGLKPFRLSAEFPKQSAADLLRPDPLPHALAEAQAEAGPSRARQPSASASAAARPSPSHSVPASPTPSSAAQPAAVPGAGAAGKKRRPRRLINLDSTTDPSQPRGGSVRLPPKTKLYADPGDDLDSFQAETVAKGGAGQADQGGKAQSSRNGDGDRGGHGAQGGENADALQGTKAAEDQIVRVKKGRRGRVSASMFEPS